MLSKYGTKGEIGKDQEVIIILMIPNAVLIHHFIDFDLAAPLCAPTDRLLVVEQLPRGRVSAGDLRPHSGIHHPAVRSG